MSGATAEMTGDIQMQILAVCTTLQTLTFSLVQARSTLDSSAQDALSRLKDCIAAVQPQLAKAQSFVQCSNINVPIPFALQSRDTTLKILEHVRCGSALAVVSRTSVQFRVLVRRAVLAVARREFPCLAMPLPWTFILHRFQKARQRGAQSADDAEQDHESAYVALYENSPVESMGALNATVAAVGAIRRNRDHVQKAFCTAISLMAPKHAWAVVQGGALGPLLEMIQNVQSDDSAAQAAGVLGNLASSDLGKISVIHAGAITPLVNLLREGGDESKTKVAGALQNIAISDAGEAAVIAAGVVVPLVAFLRQGSEEGKTNAAGLIGNIACSLEGKVAVLDAGAVVPLVAFLREGGDEGKTYVAGAHYHCALTVTVCLLSLLYSHCHRPLAVTVLACSHCQER